MAKAWPIRRGTTAREAAGEIHGDFEKFFKSAKVAHWKKFCSAPNLAAAEAKMMIEVSANHEMEDGEVFLVEHNAPSRK